MNTRAAPVLVPVLLFTMLVSACQILPPVVGPSVDQREQTAIVQTIEARLTQQAEETANAEATQGVLPTLIPTNTATPAVLPPVLSTPTSIPPTEVVILPTFTPILPSATPTSVPTSTPPPVVVITQIPDPADWAELVRVVSPVSDALILTGSKVTQTWRLKNIGTTTWNNTYALVFTSGNSMGANTVIPLTTSIRPGEIIDLSVELTAPAQSGELVGYWMLRNSGGKLFGLGSQAANPFAARLNVIAYKTADVPEPDFPVDFTSLICEAKWIGSFTKPTLPCENFKDPQPYWAAVTLNPKFEDGKQEDERAIWVHLDGKKDGWIQAIYDPFVVQSGDRFVAWIGCLDGSKSCDVTFSLDYMTGFEYQSSLGKWDQTYDGKIEKLDIDLSSLAGKEVKLLLGVTNRSGSAADVFWFVPGIRR